MDTNDYIEWTRDADLYPEDASFECYVLGLLSEAGEVAGKLKKEYRDDADHSEAIWDEASDVLWYLARIIDSYGKSFEDLMDHNYNKIEMRKLKDTIRGSGDDR